jgi:hypothetical protein
MRCFGIHIHVHMHIHIHTGHRMYPGHAAADASVHRSNAHVNQGEQHLLRAQSDEHIVFLRFDLDSIPSEYYLNEPNFWYVCRAMRGQDLRGATDSVLEHWSLDVRVFASKCACSGGTRLSRTCLCVLCLGVVFFVSSHAGIPTSMPRCNCM